MSVTQSNREPSADMNSLTWLSNAIKLENLWILAITSRPEIVSRGKTGNSSLGLAVGPLGRTEANLTILQIYKDRIQRSKRPLSRSVLEVSGLVRIGSDGYVHN